MTDLPFSITADAAAWIQKIVREGYKTPDLADMNPTLCLAFDHVMWDTESREIKSYPVGLSILIGWDHPETTDDRYFIEMEINGTRVYAPPGVWEMLKGKQIVLETVDLGFPKPSGKVVQLLRPR
jgi:hypothetical protein